MPFRTESSTFQEGNFILNTPLIDIESCFYIIESIGNNVQGLKELIGKGIFGRFADSVKFGSYFSLE